MNYQNISPEAFKTTQWTGGATTELYIYPEGADFKSREFEFRLSIATINIEESDFTPLPDVDRTLLLLEGELELIHEGHHSTILKPLEQDRFSGSWKTKCIGKGKDFNLMTKGLKGTVDLLRKDTTIDDGCEFVCLYCYTGNLSIGEITLGKNQLIVIQKSSILNVKIEGLTVKVSVN